MAMMSPQIPELKISYPFSARKMIIFETKEHIFAIWTNNVELKCEITYFQAF